MSVNERLANIAPITLEIVVTRCGQKTMVFVIEDSVSPVPEIAAIKMPVNVRSAHVTGVIESLRSASGGGAFQEKDV